MATSQSTVATGGSGPAACRIVVASSPQVQHHPHLARLLESYYKLLLRLANRRARCRQLTADLVNDAIVICLEQVRAGKLAELDQRLVGYILRVCMNLLRNHRRSIVNRIDTRAHSGELDACTAPEGRDRTDEERIRQVVNELLTPLSARNRELIRRLYLQEEDKDSLCQSLGMSIPQINLRISRARRQMRATCIAKGWNQQDLF